MSACPACSAVPLPHSVSVWTPARSDRPSSECPGHWGLPYKNLLKGTALGYAYAIQFLEIDDNAAIQHLQQQILKLDLNMTQKRQLEVDLVQHIQYLFSEQDQQLLDMKTNKARTTATQYV